MSLYLDLMKRVLLGLTYEDIASNTGKFDVHARMTGWDWPAHAHTMIGWERLTNVETCVQSVLDGEVPGDLVECGVWRGGTCIFMQSILKERGENRQVWVVDSFKGVPPPELPEDKDFNLYIHPELSVSQAQVKHNFELYNLLGENVHFLEGWFADTLPTAPIEKIAVLRCDGDLYKSTMNILENLYPKLSPGGYCIIDDYSQSPCALAVETYRKRMGITDPEIGLETTGVYWRKSGTV